MAVPEQAGCLLSSTIYIYIYILLNLCAVQGPSEGAGRAQRHLSKQVQVAWVMLLSVEFCRCLWKLLSLHGASHGSLQIEGARKQVGNATLEEATHHHNSCKVSMCVKFLSGQRCFAMDCCTFQARSKASCRSRGEGSPKPIWRWAFRESTVPAQGKGRASWVAGASEEWWTWHPSIVWSLWHRLGERVSHLEKVLGESTEAALVDIGQKIGTLVISFSCSSCFCP